MGATEEYVDHIVDIVLSVVPGLRVSVRPALEIDDVSVVEFEHPEISSMELVVATDAAFVKVLIGRYVFDAVPLDDLPGFAERLCAGQVTLRKGRVLGGYRLRVTTPARVYEAVGPRGALPLEDWEAHALEQ
jgi:hypothetical protein